MFKAILINKDDQGYHSVLSDVDEQQLPAGDVTVKVVASTINYKDALAITGKAPVVRSFPMVPGIDLVGEVLQSDSKRFSVGDKVLLNGFGVGEGHWGGLAEKARLKSDWLIPLPSAITAEHAMAVGTAGYTAMLCVLALQKHGITPEQGEVLVTGANGGVGSYAVRLLSKMGYQVVAATGRPDESAYLKKLGAVDILPRSQFSEPGKPLQKERWAAVVDCVGSHTLANACASTRYGGAVAACGLAQGMDFPSSVAPFILRGVTLYGIDSVMRPLADRVQAWQQLSDILSPEDFDTISHVISLDQVIESATALLAGKVQGRVIVKMA
ncbi:MAG: alcohol dehydrogenase [Rheinheimera sp.]|uniref:acrylyl-CoA reductase (NADPH) n=1 Tax=Arsukibacterium sp. UBA3155 TaxID=1946058 RepID=UPI000C916EA0|nr:MDR family oxidoreductase [Arsukibacterium sp. UBA3155]MAD76172.1 alcohol dehydrogenase [Rheinheimera sp.]|tara:strand:- start:90314 stop:91294 length:981 start_codon:yes stop_codon:yes gene_type:complete